MMIIKTHRTICCALVVGLSMQMVVCSNIGGTRQNISLSSDGGYSNILIAIDESVEEDLELIDKLKSYFNLASEVLLAATNNRLYFESFILLLPSSWKYNSSWQYPSTETVDGARVIVGPANSAWGDTPYTLQPGQCGQEGDYILLTPEYLKNATGKSGVKPEKRLVKEFAHLKWGLFDEAVPVDYKYTAQFYGLDSQLQPTRCVNEFDGDYIDTESNDGKCRGYLYEEQTYSPTCKFVPRDGKFTFATASLMYAEYIDTVVSFCSESGSTPHNRLAPNRQNKLCDQRSAWEVMLTLDDFVEDHETNRNGVSPPPPTFTMMQKYQDVVIGSTTTPSAATPSTTTSSATTPSATTPSATTPSATTPSTTTPSITVNITSTGVECSQDIVCLALDVSGSMDLYERITKMGLAVRTYISHSLRSGTAVGIVSFSTQAKVLADMTEILSSSDKDNLLSVIPIWTESNTGIGSGLDKCKDLLVGYAGDKVGDTRIVVLTDGGENVAPSVSEVLPGIQNLGITLDAVLYSQNADNVLIDASKDTGGLWFAVSDSLAEEELFLNLQKTVERQCSVVAVTLSSEKVIISVDETNVTKVVYLDATIGVNTTLLFSYNYDIEVNVTVESGNHVTILRDENAKLLTAVIEGEVSGEVEYTITKVNVAFQRIEEIVTVVTASPIPGVDPIRINARKNEGDIQFKENTQLIIYVDAFQKYTPVLNLTVTVTIETNTGDQEVLICKDDGTGLDSTPDDGVYTATFNPQQFTGDGYYRIRIYVDGEGILMGDQLNRKKRCISCVEESLGRVVRTTSGGAVNVAGHFPVSDKTSPEKIKDLTAVSLKDAEVFTFQWTAPGDDLNVGAVSGYTVAVSNDSTLVNLRELPNNHEAILTNLSSLLVEAGITLELQINTSKISSTFFGREPGTNTSTYYFRLSTVDDEGNVAAYSNPAEATVINIATLVLAGPTTMTTTNTMTTTTSPTTTTAKPTTTTTPTTDSTDISIYLGIIIGVPIGAASIAIIVGIVFAVKGRYPIRKVWPV